MLAGALRNRRHQAAWGATAGAAIAALDLRLIGRHMPAIRELPLLPQVADHVAFGAAVGICLQLASGDNLSPIDREGTP